MRIFHVPFTILRRIHSFPSCRLEDVISLVSFSLLTVSDG